jgi:thioredoxin 1
MKKIFVMVLFAASCSGQSNLLTPDQFESKLKQLPTAQLLDVRTPEEFGNAHLSGAKNLDYRNESFLTQIQNLDKEKPVMVYCLGGGRSGAAAKALQEAGFKEIYDLQGGFLKWTSAGKKFDQNKEVTKKSGMSKEAFEKLIASDKPVLIDFFATWCGPCQQMMPTIKKLKQEYGERAFIETIDYDQNKGLAQSVGVDEIPMLLVYQKSKLVWRGIGLTQEETLRKIIDENLAK